MDYLEYRSIGYTEKYYPENLNIENITFDFTDRDSYFEWRAEWIEKYNILADRIRQEKSLRRGEGMSSAQALVSKLSLEARGMLIERKASKAHSWGMRNAAKYVESIVAV